MNNLIELQDVNLIRNGKALLKEINWQVKENECWAILGLNGAGKSTLLKLLMSEYWASSGQINCPWNPLLEKEAFLSCVSVLGSLAPLFQKDCQSIF